MKMSPDAKVDGNVPNFTLFVEDFVTVCRNFVVAGNYKKRSFASALRYWKFKA